MLLEVKTRTSDAGCLYDAVEFRPVVTLLTLLVSLTCVYVDVRFYCGAWADYL